MNQDRPQNISFGNQIGRDLIQTPHGTDGQRVENIDLLMSDLLNMNFQNLPPGNIAIGNQVGGDLTQTISTEDVSQ